MYKKPDYFLKSKILKEGVLLEEFKKCSKSIYHYVYGLSMDNDISYQSALKISNHNSHKCPTEWKECERISHAHCKRVIHIRKRISEMLLNSDCIFLTFTFTNEKLLSTSAETRKDKVKRALTSLECPYVANIDFGKKNHREHYHALVATDKIDYRLWHYGALNGIKVRNNTEDKERLSRYIAKLTNHAIKETTKRSVIMYSRKKYVCIDRKWVLLDKNGQLVSN